MKTISVEDFDPNIPNQSVSLWMVYGGGRPKVYHTLGPAITLFRRRSLGKAKLFEWDPSTCRWELRAARLPHSPDCELCFGSTIDHPWVGQWDSNGNWRRLPDTRSAVYDQGKHVFVRKGGKLVHPLQLVYTCPECREVGGLE